jgi:hypothetical protein
MSVFHNWEVRRRSQLIKAQRRLELCDTAEKMFLDFNHRTALANVAVLLEVSEGRSELCEGISGA